MFRALLHNRIRQPKESLPDLAHEIRKLVRLAYPSGEQSIIEIIALEHFIDALSDPDTKWRIQQTRPQSLDQAVRVAVELEAFQMANRQKANKRPVRAITSTDPQPDQEAPNSQLEQIVLRMQTLMSDGLKALENKVSDLTRNSGRDHRNPGNRMSSVECYHCGRKGHIRSHCPELVGNKHPRGNHNVQGN
jgi:hypothetical protein